MFYQVHNLQYAYLICCNTIRIFKIQIAYWFISLFPIQLTLNLFLFKLIIHFYYFSFLSTVQKSFWIHFQFHSLLILDSIWTDFSNSPTLFQINVSPQRIHPGDFTGFNQLFHDGIVFSESHPNPIQVKNLSIFQIINFFFRFFNWPNWITS